MWEKKSVRVPKLQFVSTNNEFGSFYLSSLNSSFSSSMHLTEMFSHPFYSCTSLCFYNLRGCTNVCSAICVCVDPCTEKHWQRQQRQQNCEETDNSFCCCVGVTQLSFIVPTLCNSLWERHWEKPLQRAETSGFLIVCPTLQKDLCSASILSSELVLICQTAQSERHCLWRATKSWQTWHFEA